MDIDALQPIHPIILLVTIICIIVTVIWMAHHKEHWLIGVLPMIFFLNVFIYNVYLHLSLIDWETLEIWSGAIRLQALGSFLVMLLFYPIRRK